MVDQNVPVGFVFGSEMPPAPLQVSPLAARRFMRRALLLDGPVPSVAAALAHHGYIQIDPINVCGRMHDLILRNRVAGFREGDLMRYLHGDATPRPATARTAFEHHLPDRHILVAFPLDAWPHLLAAMRARTRRHGAWAGKLTPRERELVPSLLAEIAARGPLSSEDFEHDGRRARKVWGTFSLIKGILQKLFFHGRLLIAQRDKNRRRYDLPERVLPAATLFLPEPSAVETARWSALLTLRQRRLAALKREELRHVHDEVQPVVVDGLDCPKLYCLREDTAALSTASDLSTLNPQLSTPAAAPLLLAPLDPLIYDRRVTQRLWEFDYTWEVYTPAPKRVRGYYALPVLAGTELVGHVDPKADREAGRLRIVSRRVRRGYNATAAVRELGAFLGLRA